MNYAETKTNAKINPKFDREKIMESVKMFLSAIGISGCKSKYSIFRLFLIIFRKYLLFFNNSVIMDSIFPKNCDSRSTK